MSTLYDYFSSLSKGYAAEPFYDGLLFFFSQYAETSAFLRQWDEEDGDPGPRSYQIEAVADFLVAEYTEDGEPYGPVTFGAARRFVYNHSDDFYTAFKECHEMAEAELDAHFQYQEEELNWIGDIDATLYYD